MDKGKMGRSATGNIDPPTVAGFGAEWRAFDQSRLAGDEWQSLFDRYFSIFPWERLPEGAEGFDLGCGSGRWALGVAPRVGTLHCIDPSPEALAVASRRLQAQTNARFHRAAADDIPLARDSQDFGYALGVLHHVPDTGSALRTCVEKLKPGAPFLLYLYYAFDNRPSWFRGVWRLSDLGRHGISRLPFGLRKMVTTVIAALVYWPSARAARFAAHRGLDVTQWPLSAYRDNSFYTMRTDALDRFGTRLERRFTRARMAALMIEAGLGDIRFSEHLPFWVAIGTRRQ